QTIGAVDRTFNIELRVGFLKDVNLENSIHIRSGHQDLVLIQGFQVIQEIAFGYLDFKNFLPLFIQCEAVDFIDISHKQYFPDHTHPLGRIQLSPAGEKQPVNDQAVRGDLCDESIAVFRGRIGFQTNIGDIVKLAVIRHALGVLQARDIDSLRKCLPTGEAYKDQKE